MRKLLVLCFAASVVTLSTAAGAEYDFSQEKRPDASDCASGQKVPVSYADDDLARVHEFLDSHVCYVDPRNVDLLMLRAQLVLTLTARYGAASIERHSKKPAEDATRLVAHINAAENALAKAYKANSPRGFYDVYRVDLVLRMAEAMIVASEPTRSAIFSSLLSLAMLDSDTVRHGFAYLKDMLVDKMYLDAYRGSFMNLVSGMKSGKPEQGDWSAVNGQLDDACKRLGKLASLRNEGIVQCTPFLPAPPAVAQR